MYYYHILPYITIYYHILPKSIKTLLGLGLRMETRLSVLGKIQNIICIGFSNEIQKCSFIFIFLITNHFSGVFSQLDVLGGMVINDSLNDIFITP